MKKVKDIEKKKRLNNKILRKKLKRLRRLRRKKKPQKQPITYQKAYQDKEGTYHIEAPENFSLINNVSETIQFFDAFYNAMKRRDKIFINLRNVKTMTTDVILYILSHLEYNKTKFGQRANILGSNPKDEKCNKIFETSGFYDYVYHNKTLTTDPAIYTIKHGSKVLGVIAKEIKDFTIKTLGVTKADVKSIYRNIVECMQNTNNHAYNPESKYNSWWLMASYDSTCEKVCFTFLDNGLTIPRTIKKRYGESFKNLLGIQADGKLILSTLQGDFQRTATRIKHRGKGLPMIYSTATNKQIEDLHLLSRRGFVDAINNKSVELKNTFHGTLLTWSYTKEDGGKCDD